MRDVHPAREAQRLGARDDELELEGAEVGRVVKMDVDSDAVLGGEAEDRVELTDRVAVDARGIDSAHVVDAVAGGLAHEIEHAGATDDAVLREGDDLDDQCPLVRRGGFAHRLDRSDADIRIDVHMGADSGGAVADELRQHAFRDLGARIAEVAAAASLVADPALGAAFAGVGLPGEPEPRHVDVRMRVDEPWQGQEAPAVDLAVAGGVVGGRLDRGDHARGRDQDVACRAAPRADIAQSRRGARGSRHGSILPRAGLPSRELARIRDTRQP